MEVLSEAPASHTIKGRHSTLYPVQLPPNLGRKTLEEMVRHYAGYLHDAFSELTEQPDTNPLQHTASNLSSESDGGISIWSVECTSSTSIQADAGEWQGLSENAKFRDTWNKLLPTTLFRKLFPSFP